MKRSEDVSQEQPRGSSASTSRLARTDFQLVGFWLHLARGTWLGFLLIELLVRILASVSTGGQGLTLCPFIVSCDVTPATARVLHHLSIAPTSYVIYNLVLAVLQSLIFLSVGGFIFWRKSREPVALVASFTLVNIGFWSLSPSTSSPLEEIFGNMYGLCLFTALGFFLVTFPDGRFVPRWSWLLVVLWLVQAILNEIPGPYNINLWPPLLTIAEVVLTYGGTLSVLLYRYVRVFSSSQRQQAKWLLFSFGGLFTGIILYILIGDVVPGLQAPDSLYQLADGTLITILFTFIPLSIAMAILRSRLWEIDVLIRRTLIYSALTLIMTGVYVGLVIGLSALLRRLISQDNNVAIVLSTLAIYILFQPLHRVLQALIDWRFYRRKYDAARTLTAFSATLRNEMDLDQLREQLLAVVQETMQPAYVSLWLYTSELAGKYQALPAYTPRPTGDDHAYEHFVREREGNHE